MFRISCQSVTALVGSERSLCAARRQRSIRVPRVFLYLTHQSPYLNERSLIQLVRAVQTHSSAVTETEYTRDAYATLLGDVPTDHPNPNQSNIRNLCALRTTEVQVTIPMGEP